MKYTKKIAEVTSVKNQKGFKFTKAGYWHEEFVMNNDLMININKIKGFPDVFVRVIIEKVDREKGNKVIKTINKQNLFSINFIEDEKLITSKNWILVENNNEQKFRIAGPKVIRLGTRYIYNEIDVSENFTLAIKQDGLWMGTHLFDKQKSDNDAKLLDGNEELSKFRSMYFNVPEGIHYYTFELPKNSKYKNDKVLIRLDEFKISK